MNLTDKFIEEIYKIADSKIENSEIIQIKNCIIDYIAVTNAGAKLLKTKTDKLLQSENSTESLYSVIGYQKKASLHTALLINSMNAHAAELDDGVRYANLHPGVSVITALLTVAEQLKLSSQDVLRGILVGYETSIRIAASIQPSHRNMGYHATGTCGAFGVALGLCAAVKLDKNQFKTALTAAASGSSGMLNVIKDQSDLKPYNNSLAVFAGYNAYQLATVGFIPSDDVLNGKWGYFSLKTKELDTSKLLNSEGKSLIHDVYRKYYAACRHCHPAIEAAIVCKKEKKINLDLIKSVHVETYSLAVDGHESKNIQNSASAKMSTPYSVAVALLKEKAGIDEFESATIKNTQIQDLLQKVVVTQNTEMTNQVPEKRPAKVSITMKDGTVYSKQIDLAKGEPENPFTKFELEDKFISLVTYNNLNIEEAKKLLNKIYNFENNLNALLESI